MDPELEIKENLKTINYIEEVIKKLDKSKKYKTLDQDKIECLTKYLESKKKQLNRKIDRLTDEIVAAVEVLAEVDQSDY